MKVVFLTPLLSKTEKKGYLSISCSCI